MSRTKHHQDALSPRRYPTSQPTKSRLKDWPPRLTLQPTKSRHLLRALWLTPQPTKSHLRNAIAHPATNEEPEAVAP